MQILSVNRKLYPRSVVKKLEAFLAVEKERFAVATETKTKPSKRVELFIQMSWQKACEIGFLGNMSDWGERIKR